VFDGPEDYHNRIDDPSLKIDENTILFMRGVGPIGYPGSAEVVNMRPPAALLKRGVMSLPCIGDGRQSGHLGLALDCQCLARSGGRRRTGAA
jgi:dihydroxy-acid dehydratase